MPTASAWRRRWCWPLDPAAHSPAARRPEEIAAYLELHIEQGPCLEQEGLALGVVEAINGARRLNCRFTGEAGHAGTVPMSHRKMRWPPPPNGWCVVETLTRGSGNRSRWVRCAAPGAVNVIPGDVTLTWIFGGRHDQPLDALLDTLLKEAQAIASVASCGSAPKSFTVLPPPPAKADCSRY
jgi:allantoate deiminase